MVKRKKRPGDFSSRESRTRTSFRKEPRNRTSAIGNVTVPGKIIGYGERSPPARNWPLGL